MLVHWGVLVQSGSTDDMAVFHAVLLPRCLLFQHLFFTVRSELIQFVKEADNSSEISIRKHP